MSADRKLKPVPAAVARIRQDACRRHACTAVADHQDPCARCENGHWGWYVFACRDVARAEAALPSSIEMAANLSKSLGEEALAVVKGRPAISEEEAQRRFAICQTNQCGQFRASDERCAACGCYLSKKTAWRSQACPKGYW